MADITAGMVKDLRDKTDAPMMECKKALVEAGGDLDKAVELLRVRLGNKASKAATRAAGEGTVAIHLALDGKSGAIVEVNCETDFVAKTGDFQAFVASVAEVIAKKNPQDPNSLGGLALGNSTVEDTRRALVGRIGENISIRRFASLKASGRLYQYIHGGAKIGVLVDVIGGDEQLGRDLAMHIAASKPMGLSGTDVPADLVDTERNIATAKAAESGKPADIQKKMVEGSVQKFLKEATLLGQVFVKDPGGKQTIEALLKSRGASVSRFVLYVVGTEKKGNGSAT
jgi:elongation factor Ts